MSVQHIYSLQIYTHPPRARAMRFFRSMCQAVARAKEHPLKAKTRRRLLKSQKEAIQAQNLNFHRKVQLVQDDFYRARGLVHVCNAARAYLVNHHVPKPDDFFSEKYEDDSFVLGFKKEDSESKARYHVDLPIPKFFLTVNYPTSVVYYGNHLKPQQCVFEPAKITVSSNYVEHKFVDDLAHNYYTLYMADLDGNLYSFKENFCHWLVCNVKLIKNVESSTNPTVAELDLKNADTIINYVPPVPWEGTGQHRVAFVLYQQKDKINVSKIKQSADHEFVVRSVDQKNLGQIVPKLKSIESYSWFQCEYDISVSNTCKYVLKVREATFAVDDVKVKKSDFQNQFKGTSTRSAVIGHYLREQDARKLVNRGQTRVADLDKYYDWVDDRMAGKSETGYDDELDREVELDDEEDQ